MTFQGTQYTAMPEELKKTRQCKLCQSDFIARSGAHVFCTEQCKGKHKYVTKAVTTEGQYLNISGNWPRYFDRLLGKGRRGVLSRNDLLALLEKQDGKCALSGEVLTCTLEAGKKFKTNASIDRLTAGGSYAPDNIQLVCAALNGFRIDTTLDEFINFCHKVSDYQRKKGGHPCRI